jgi:hypothetical protein
MAETDSGQAYVAAMGSALVSRARGRSPIGTWIYRWCTRSGYDRHAMDTDRYRQQHKEWFSRAFLVAIASVAGFPVTWTGGTEDIDGVDATVRDGGVTVDFQLKATSTPKRNGECLLFDLDIPTYHKLIGVRSSPGYLLVVTLPEEKSNWVASSDHELLLRHRSHWIDLSGMEPTENKQSIRLALPLQNQLTAQTLTEIMRDARRRLVGS